MSHHVARSGTEQSGLVLLDLLVGSGLLLMGLLALQIGSSKTFRQFQNGKNRLLSERDLATACGQLRIATHLGLTPDAPNVARIIGENITRECVGGSSRYEIITCELSTRNAQGEVKTLCQALHP